MGLFDKLFGTLNHSSASSQRISTPQFKKKGPTPDILEVVRKYKEVRIGADDYESIRRCDDLITELEWYSSISRTNAMNPEVREANFNVLWHAVCEHDMVYLGKKYPMDMMSNIGLKIIENCNYNLGILFQFAVL